MTKLMSGAVIDAWSTTSPADRKATVENILSIGTEKRGREIREREREGDRERERDRERNREREGVRERERERERESESEREKEREREGERETEMREPLYDENDMRVVNGLFKKVALHYKLACITKQLIGLRLYTGLVDRATKFQLVGLSSSAYTVHTILQFMPSS